ncbi:MAG: putative cysteine cluster protein YcgN (CxxCxxCC family) [Arenicella sp.]|jgi:uncharacterized cysteine cluster protein YcgN (CxxCxxCC family)
MSKPFWETKQLDEMTHSQWESVCDGCAKCCLVQLQDEATEQLVFTNIACDLLKAGNCQCSDYANRSVKVPTCMTMTPENVEECAEFAPPSCAYRLLLQGDPLPAWHHLRSGSRDTIHETGNSVRGRIKFEREIKLDDLEDYVVDWP